MSEYQYIEFRAVDRPLTDKELNYAETQSTRAEISRWCFTNEYHYSDFRGNENRMLRNGYDVFLHFANFGIRTIKIRLPSGPPFPKKLWSKFVDGNFLKWKADPKGKAGLLILEPYHEPYDSYREFEDCLTDVIDLRQSLIAGDLRALYVLWLCVAGDQNFDSAETTEPPVPRGLQDLDLELDSLFHFFDIDPLMIEAAANDSAPKGKTRKKNPTPVIQTPADRLKPWLKSLNASQAKGHLEQLLVGDTASVKAAILYEIAQNHAKLKLADWPTIERNRTYEELLNLANDLREDDNAKEKKKQVAKAKRDVAKAERERKKRMAEMIEDPKKWLAESERLANERGRTNYKLAAEILADLKEAIGGTKGAAIARKHAAHLTRKHPTLTQLKGSLRKHGVLD